MKQITVCITDERYEALQQIANSTKVTVDQLAQIHLEDIADNSVPAQVLRTRMYIASAVEKAKAYESGKIFNAKDLIPEGVPVSELHGYSRHIHGALQKDGAFTKIDDVPSAMIIYRRN